MIHPSSIISASANIGKNVQIGAFCIIGDNVDIGDNCVFSSHIVVKGHSKIGKNNVFFQFCSIGEDCQDKKYAGETTYLEIGDDNVFRESCTIHRGTIQDQRVTRIGSRNLFMVNAHVAHDCVLGDDNVFANNCAIAGHVHVANQVILGGMTAVHQFCHIGAHSFTGGGAVVLKDIPPYIMVSGTKHIPQGINSEGLKRRGFTSSAIMAIKRAYKVIYRNGNTIDQALVLLNEMAEAESDVKILADFVASSKRGIVR
jgi:UDP-N-acetylglucosamine acyltransferase